MTNTPDMYFHPTSYRQQYGNLLQEGDELEDGDRYTSSNGRWEDCPCALTGLTLGPQTPNLLWVRP